MNQTGAGAVPYRFPRKKAGHSRWEETWRRRKEHQDFLAVELATLLGSEFSVMRRIQSSFDRETTSET